MGHFCYISNSFRSSLCPMRFAVYAPCYLILQPESCIVHPASLPRHCHHNPEDHPERNRDHEPDAEPFENPQLLEKGMMLQSAGNDHLEFAHLERLWNEVECALLD